MRPATLDINNGKIKAASSTFVSQHYSTSADLGKVFHFFLPTLFFGFEKPALAITNLAHLLLPCRQAYASAKSKELNFLTHGGFKKTILAIPKLSTFIFASTKAKINKLNCLPSFIRCPPLSRAVLRVCLTHHKARHRRAVILLI